MAIIIRNEPGISFGLKFANANLHELAHVYKLKLVCIELNHDEL